ncbi:hypothetical protein Sjap_018477 [Stephania japonica]|uniref:pectinesterase n=1 Tax=Stephania japonica TaxID=461633 RepID=A0AAP0I825_9MAGN
MTTKVDGKNLHEINDGHPPPLIRTLRGCETQARAWCDLRHPLQVMVIRSAIPQSSATPTRTDSTPVSCLVSSKTSPGHGIGLSSDWTNTPTQDNQKNPYPPSSSSSSSPWPPPSSSPSSPSLLFFSLSSAAHRRHHQPTPKPPTAAAAATSPQLIQSACNATRFPAACASALTQYTTNLSAPLEILTASISISSHILTAAQLKAWKILESSLDNRNRSSAARICLEVLQNANLRQSAAAAALPRRRNKDARAWLSASLVYQYDCWSALKYVNDSQLINETMTLMDSLIMLTSNALSMSQSYDLFGDNVGLWRAPLTERDGFWEDGNSDGGGGGGGGGGVPADLAVDATVSKGDCGGRCYKTLQEAVEAAPDNGEKRFVVRIEEGVYEEIVRVPYEKKNVVFLGDGMGKTVITGSLKVGPGLTTYNTSTVGPDAHQAVAFRSDSDLSIIENCEFLGNQDTLYAHSLRQFYKSCRIEGNVDFIFGNSAAVFQDCLILIRPRDVAPEKGESNAVTAHGRIDPAQSTGFVFWNCTVNGTDKYVALYRKKPKVHRNYLGRPWKEYSRTVFLGCYLEEIVSAPGWMPWSGDFALSTLYYGEFESRGPGGSVSGRVGWSSQVPKEHVGAYSLQSFIQGNDWIPNSNS